MVQYSFSLQGKCLHDNKGELDQWLPPVCVIAILLLIYCILQTAWSITHSLYNESVSMTIKVSLINGYRQLAVIAILLPVYCILLTAWSSSHSLYKESVSMTIKVSSIKDLRQFVVMAILFLIYSILQTVWSLTHSLYKESVSMTINGRTYWLRW